MRTATFLMILAGAQAQIPDAALQFEVASIKPSAPPNGRMRVGSRGGPGTDDPGLYRCENCGVSWLIEQAFDLKDYQLSGPEWQSTRFTVSANNTGRNQQRAVPHDDAESFGGPVQTGVPSGEKGNAGLRTGSGEGRSEDEGVGWTAGSRPPPTIPDPLFSEPCKSNSG